MSLLRDMLGITPTIIKSSFRLNENVKKDSKITRNSGINREVYSLCENGLPPQSISSHGLLLSKPSTKKVTNHWKIESFTNPARSDKLTLYHWTKESDMLQDYPFARYNFSIKLPKYSEEFYKQELINLDPEWSFEETQHLWDLCELYDLRFHVILDRYNPIYNRTIEQIKKRYYSVSKRIVEYQFEDKIQQEVEKHGRSTAQMIASVKDEKNRQPLIKFQYSMEKDLERKLSLEKQYHITENMRRRESELLELITNYEINLKKTEKRREELKKIKKKFELQDDQIIPLTPSLGFRKPCTTSASYQLELLRSTIPKKLCEQVTNKLNSLGAKFPILFSQRVINSYSNLRTDVAININLQKKIQKIKKEKEYWELQVSLLMKPQISTHPEALQNDLDSYSLNLAIKNNILASPQLNSHMIKGTGKRKSQKMTSSDIDQTNIDIQSDTQGLPQIKQYKDHQELKKESLTGDINEKKIGRKQKRIKNNLEAQFNSETAPETTNSI